MVDKLLLLCYKILPSSIKGVLGQSYFLKYFRDLILRPKGIIRRIGVNVVRKYDGFVVRFKFYASIKTASRASIRGIENTLLLNSVRLLKQRGTLGNSYIIDVGANFGFLSLVWSRIACKEGGKIFSFEPNPIIHECLRKSVLENKLSSLIVSEQVAVGSVNQEVSLHLYNETSNIQNLNKGTLKVIKVKQITLDSYMASQLIERCDLIKVDVDGTELEVVKGATDIINRFNPILILELNGNSELISLIRSLGYKIFDMELRELSLNSLDVNVFCVK